MLVKSALIRRGVAMAVAGLTSFREHQHYADWLFSRLLEEAPAGFMKVSMTQLTAVDRRVFELVAANTRKGLKSNIIGELP